MQTPYYRFDHGHCWNQGKSPACGQKLEDHKACCLCAIPYGPRVSQEKPDYIEYDVQIDEGGELVLSFHEQALVTMGEMRGREERNQEVVKIIKELSSYWGNQNEPEAKGALEDLLNRIQEKP